MKTTPSYITPPHLTVLGIKVCKDCGHAMSQENTICYQCGFNEDDMALHEDIINRKYRKAWNENSMMYVVKAENNQLYKNNNKHHIMQNGENICGNVSKVKTQMLGKLDKITIKIFNQNPCSICFQKLNSK
ncbi:MAG: hypothetical protein J5I47_01905 [Vicingus serpentipes]|nr:hypothetical protein [Vicingus serpentipes]